MERLLLLFQTEHNLYKTNTICLKILSRKEKNDERSF